MLQDTAVATDSGLSSTGSGGHHGRFATSRRRLSSSRRAKGRGYLLPAAVWLLAAALLGPAALPAAVLVELFTSQGCSSCPPADRLLTQLGSEPGLAGEVVPLAFHVDYWNWIGWRDPFSAAGWSRRQRTYASAFRSDRIYTPQAVVGGRRDCNGGDLRCIRAAVEEIAAQPGGEVALALAPAAGGAVRVTVTARPPAGAGPLDLMLAVFEKGLETPVGRGENATKR